MQKHICMRKEHGSMPNQHVTKAKEEGQKEEDDVAMIEGEGQSCEMVGFREAHKDLHN